MFKKLKEKIKSSIEKIVKKEKEEVEETIRGKEEEKEERKEEIKEKGEKEKKGIIKRIKEKVSKKKIREDDLNEFLEELEIILLENNVALDVALKILEEVKQELVGKEVEKKKIGEVIKETLANSLRKIMDFEVKPLEEIVKESKDKPFVIVFLGVNGSGKTTTIAKVAKRLMDSGLKGVIAASDTFRAGSIEQLEEHAKNVGIKVIKHNYGSDPTAVAYDAVQHAKAKNLDFVLIDTAGRLHSNKNLIGELKKLIRVIQPNMKIFVGESIVGNDSIEQAETFQNEVGIDAIILTKADVDEKGGTMISISYITKKPILYLGTGQNYDDLILFDKEKIIESLGLN